MSKPSRFVSRVVFLAAAALLSASASSVHAQAATRDEPDTQPVLLNARELLRLTTRAYPPDLRRQRLTGTVEVHMKVMPDGMVDSTSISILHRDGDAAFGPAAARVVRQLRFRPATIDGLPVAVWVDFPVNFGRPQSTDGASTDVQRDGRIFKDRLPPPRP